MALTPDIRLGWSGIECGYFGIFFGALIMILSDYLTKIIFHHFTL
jgi:hypothetical protein